MWATSRYAKLSQRCRLGPKMMGCLEQFKDQVQTPSYGKQSPERDSASVTSPIGTSQQQSGLDEHRQASKHAILSCLWAFAQAAPSA